MFNIFNTSESCSLIAAAAGTAVLGGVSGIVGSLTALKKHGLIADAVSYASLPGIALVFILTGTRSHPLFLVGAAIAGWCVVMQIFPLLRKGQLHQNSLLSLMLSVYFGFGMVLLSLSQRKLGTALAGIETFLFGQTSPMFIDVKTIIVTGAIICVLLFLFWKELFIVAFDPVYAAASGIPVIKIEMLFIAIIIGNVVIGLQTVGVILMSALLVAPAAAARQWTNNVRILLFLPVLFGAISGIAGNILSIFIQGLPIGPAVIICVSAIAFFSFFFAPQRGICLTYFRRKAEQNAAGSGAILKALYMLSLQHMDKDFHGHQFSVIQSLFPLKANTGALLSELRAEGLAIQTGREEWSITPSGKKRVEESKQREVKL